MDDLIIIGAGWAGLTAAALAVAKGVESGRSLKIRMIAQGIGSMIVAPGWIGAAPAAPSANGSVFDAINTIADRFATHPYALAGADSLNAALNDLYPSLKKKANIVFYSANTNVAIPTALGQLYQAPAALFSVISNAASRINALYIGFEGWRDYYPAMIGANSATIKLPLDRPWDATPTDIARAFDDPDFRNQVVQLVKPMIRGGGAVYFPAVIGMDKPHEALDDLVTQFGVPVGEVPTLPPSAPGTRFFTAMRRYLLDSGVRMQIGHPVIHGLIERGQAVGVEVAGAGKTTRFDAKAIMLASGNLYGGGLFSDDRGRVWEPVFRIPVQYTPDRTRWFNDTLLDPRGHPVHYFGVRANHRLQPLNDAGNLVAENLYVAGQILAHPNVDGAPLPTDTAEGVALATAYKAVMCALER